MSLIVDLDAIDAKRTYLQTVSRPMQMAHWLALQTEQRFQRTLTPALRCALPRTPAAHGPHHGQPGAALGVELLRRSRGPEASASTPASARS
jgi:hypothetical protein